MMKILAASALSLALAAPAFAVEDSAGAPNAPRGEQLSVSDVTAKLEAQGFKVREIESDDGLFEFEAIDSSGARVEGHAHPVTGAILNVHPDND